MMVKDIYAGLIDWAETLTGLAWYRAGEAWNQHDAVGELRITTVRNTGHDYESPESNPNSTNPGEDDLLLRMRGQREIVVEFKVESIHQNAADTAQHALELMRVRAGRSGSRAILRNEHGLDLSFASAQPLRVIESTDANGHVLSVAVLDMTFIAHFSESDDQAEADTFIEKVEVTNKIIDDGWNEEILE